MVLQKGYKMSFKTSLTKKIHPSQLTSVYETKDNIRKLSNSNLKTILKRIFINMWENFHALVTSFDKLNDFTIPTNY